MDDGTDFATAGTALLPGTTNQADPSSAFPIAGDTGMFAGTGTGQQGMTPVIGNGGGTISGGIVSVWRWLNVPFKQPMSPVSLTLMVGVILIAVIFWNFILYHIRIAAEEI